MLEQLATFLGIPLKLLFVGLVTGLLMIAFRPKGTVFLKIMYVCVCVLFSGYSDQVFRMVGWKFDEDTQVMRGFFISLFSPYLVEGITLEGEKFAKDPIKYVKQLILKFKKQ
jgi:hypothetical protein